MRAPTRLSARSAAPVAVVVAGWSGTAGAERALHSLRLADAGTTSSIDAVATLVVEPGGDLRTLEVTGGRAAGYAQGSALGAALRELTAGIGWLFHHDAVVPDRASESRDGRLRAFGERMTRGSSVLVAVVDPASADGVARELAARGADTTSALLDGGPVERRTLLPAPGGVVAVRSDAVVMRALEGAVPA